MCWLAAELARGMERVRARFHAAGSASRTLLGKDDKHLLSNGKAIQRIFEGYRADFRAERRSHILRIKQAAEMLFHRYKPALTLTVDDLWAQHEQASEEHVLMMRLAKKYRAREGAEAMLPWEELLAIRSDEIEFRESDDDAGGGGDADDGDVGGEGARGRGAKIGVGLSCDASGDDSGVQEYF